MRIVTSKELSTFKILPFDILDEAKQKVLSAGEILTPGKLIMLKKYSKLYTEEFHIDVPDSSSKELSAETIKRLMDFTYNSLQTNEFETTVNLDGTLKRDIQIRIKYYYSKVMELFLHGLFQEGLIKLQALADIMLSNIFKQYSESSKGSQVRFLGEYDICHPLNVAVISGLIAKKLEYSNDILSHVLMAALLHDIGKYKLYTGNDDIILNINVSDEDIVQHTYAGYELIKNELGLSEDIARVALEHHEHNDGSGYPRGLSNDYISELSQIVNVANYYDNLAFNRTTMHVVSNREALRAMLEVGTGRFSAKILYMFIHMFTYDDPKDFAEMSL